VATKEQVEFFKSLYDGETRRLNDLREIGKTNLSLATFYSAFLVFVVEKLRPDSLVTRALFIGAVTCLLLSFLMSLWAMQIAVFEGVTDPKKVAQGFDPVAPENSEFFLARIGDYAIASERNAKTNEKKASRLAIARYFLLAGISLHACYFIAQVIEPGVRNEQVEKDRKPG
jgi:hypothetical protein